MMKIFFFIIVIIHGLIHLMGFFSAFKISKPAINSKPISKSMGVVWLMIGLLLIGFAFSYVFITDYWILLGFISLLLSEAVIITAWNDAKFGSLLNLLILVVLIMNLL